MKYTIVVDTRVTMHLEVEAESLEDAIDKAKDLGSSQICSRCSHGEEGEWVPGSFEEYPGDSPIVEIWEGGNQVPTSEARGAWGGSFDYSDCD
jgi:hypothetical protein